MRQDNNSLAHTTWNCKYHIVFVPKYRRQIIYVKEKALKFMKQKLTQLTLTCW